MTVNEIKNAKIKAWIEECVKMCEPDNVVVVDGTTAEYDRLMQKCVDAGLATPLKKKESHWSRETSSTPSSKKTSRPAVSLKG